MGRRRHRAKDIDQRLGSPRQEAHRGAGGRNGSKWFDTTLGDPCEGPLTEGRGASTVRNAQWLAMTRDDPQ